ncbi:beta-1,3-galactosyltransferase 1-like [Ptychodera flava]|uniref:beta-1,3-galactosyltransferase 1-like n=1 Tax=Ptychodera flava TaxID=63121 RepID=UPI00396A45E7
MSQTRIVLVILVVFVTTNLVFLIFVTSGNYVGLFKGGKTKKRSHYFANINHLSGKSVSIDAIGHETANENHCDGDVFLFTMVTSSNVNYQQRRAIRETWASEKSVDGKTVATVFLVARRPDSELMKTIEAESKAYRDIIVFDFHESYLNLTLKTLLGFKWISEHCRNVRYILKTDDDVFVNYQALIRDLVKRPRENLALGQILNNITVSRDHKNKWYTSVKDYPNHSYPPYLVGTGYILSRDLIDKVGKLAPSLQFLNWEDVFVGICLHHLGVKLTNDKRFDHFNVFNFYSDKDKCLLNYTFTSHNVFFRRQLELWRVLLRRRRYPRRHPCDGVIVPET